MEKPTCNPNECVTYTCACTQGEEWRPVLNYETHYEVSNRGRVRRIKAGQGATLGIRRLATHPNGYKQVVLSKNNVSKTAKVHRLVLEAFVGPCPDGMEACHTNDVAGDNRVENLRWDTRYANIVDRMNNGNPVRPSPPRTHCRNGHEYRDGTYMIAKKGWRECIECRLDREKRANAKKRKGFSHEELKTWCKNGHLRAEAGEYVTPDGKRRQCMECRRIQDGKRDPEVVRRRSREKYWRKKAAAQSQ